MKKFILLSPLALALCLSKSFAQWQTPVATESFSSKRVINSSPFRQPFAMVMGPDDSLWVTERRGYVTRVSTVNGGKTQLLNIAGLVKFTTSGSGASLSISQDGMFGIALHPELNKGTGKDSVYLAYCYDSVGFRRVKIVAYKYNRAVPSLTNPTVLIKGIWGSNDHNGGRLVIGNSGTAAIPDYKLIYSVGDKGANQFGNACDSIESQYTPTAAQMAAGDIHRYNGKILRMNLDGSIPADNPVINGVRTHIYSYGHRNPQGLTFEKVGNSPLDVLPGGNLYESEQGPATNDEINIIDGVKNNYGWPRIAGKKDNNWYRYFQWSKSGSCGAYPGECSSNQTSSPITESTFSDPKLTDPIFDLYAGTPPGGTSCNWLAYPTIAPSSVIHYPFTNKIPGWDNCLLITTLKTSSMFRLKLNAAGTAAALTPGATGFDSVVQYFKFPGSLNRYRDIALGSDGLTFYILTDSVGTTSGPSAGAAGVTDPGRILEFVYLGSVLALPNATATARANRSDFKMYPNPVSEILTVESKRNTAKPLHYQLYDATGRMLLQGNSTKDKFDINVKAFTHGVYVIKIINAYEIIVANQKIVVN